MAVPVPPRPLPTREQIGAAVIQAVAGEPAVLAAYLFGSVARNAAGPLSDVDVAVLLDGTAGGGLVTRRLTGDVCRRLRTGRVDLVSLRELPLPVRYRVLRDGVLLVCRDAAARERFTADTVRLYLDFQPLRERAFARVRRAIVREG